MTIRFYTLFIIFSLVITGLANGQFDKKAKNVWNSGRAQLLNGKIIEGEINYNFLLSSLSISSNNSAYHYFAKDLYWFEVTHEGKTRRFYSLPYQAKQQSHTELVFYEELYSGSRIALLSLQTGSSRGIPIIGMAMGNSNSVMTSSRNIKVENVHEQLFFADKNGGLFEYAKKIEISNISLNPGNQTHSNLPLPKNSLMYRSQPYKVTDKSSIEAFSKTRYPKVRDFMKTKKLRVNTIGEMIQVIDYYESLF